MSHDRLLQIRIGYTKPGDAPLDEWTVCAGSTRI